MDIKKVTVELARPRGSFPGKIAVGWYVLNDDTVTLVEENGVPVDRFKLARKLKPGEDAKAVACVLTRQRYGNPADDFNRPLSYPAVRF